MAKNTSVILGEPGTSFAEAQISQGRYSNASDVLRAGLRLLEEQEPNLAALRGALVEGEQSGVSTRSIHDIWRAVKEEHHPTASYAPSGKVTRHL